MKNPLDKLGILLSGLCLIHCVATPIILVLFPLLGEVLHVHFHEWLFFILMIIALAAFFTGYRVHQKKTPFLWLLAALSSGYFQLVIYHDHNIYFSLLTSGLFITAHLTNHKHCNKCDHHH